MKNLVALLLVLAACGPAHESVSFEPTPLQPERRPAPTAAATVQPAPTPTVQPTPTPPRPVPGDAVYAWRGRTYALVSGDGWDAVRGQCQALGDGFDLAIINDAEEDAMLVDLVCTPNCTHGGWFFGLLRTEERPDWHWIDGSPLTYSRWAPDEPNNDRWPPDTIREPYGAMWHKVNSREDGARRGWNDTLRGGRGICEGPA